MSFTCMQVAAILHSTPRKEGAEWAYICPNHPDRNPSLKIHPIKDCFLCGPCGASGTAWQLAAFISGFDANDKASILKWLEENGIKEAREIIPWKFIEAYHYIKPDGTVPYQIKRFERIIDGVKQKRFARDPVGAQGILYNLHKIVKSQRICIVEGEKDANTMERIGFVATTAPCGSNGWKPEYSACFRSDQEVIIIPDNDAPGRKYALGIAQSLYGRAKSVSIVNLPVQPTGDVSDWAYGKHPADAALELEALIHAAGTWKPQEENDGILEWQDIQWELEKALSEVEAGGSRPSGIRTGFAKLDELTQGLWRKEVSLIAGRSSLGKTAFLCNLSFNLSKDNKVGIFSLEQTWQSIMNRIAAGICKVDSQKIRTFDLNEYERTELRKAYLDIGSRAGCWITDRMLTIDQIIEICQKKHRVSGLDFVIIDYMSLIGADERGPNREQVVAGISHRLRELAKNLNIHVSVIAQVNRQKDITEEPTLMNLRESDSTGFDADLVLFMWRQLRTQEVERNGKNILEPLVGEDGQPLTRMILTIGKQRNGPQHIRIPILFEGEFSKFTEITAFEDFSNRVE